MRRTLAIPVLLLAGLLAAAPAAALTVTYSITMTGAKEAPAPGDPDGIATGSLTLNDTTGAVSWEITYANIVEPSSMHIHAGAAGQANPPLIDLGVATSGGPGTLIGSTTASTTTIASILADPTAYYVNIHNEQFLGGAVRDQLGTVPEPGAALLFGLALAALALRRRGAR
jgi:hypothetical protein